MNMTTNIANIPMKTSKMNNNDDSEDPIVKDILQEFQEELKENQKSSNNNYEINFNPPQPSQQPPQQFQPSQPLQQPSQQQKQPKQPQQTEGLMKYYNQEVLIKTAIIIIIVGFVFSPIIFNTIIDKIPSAFSQLLIQYDFYIKIIIAFIFIYIYNLF